jgi:hypothetical protein
MGSAPAPTCAEQGYGIEGEEAARRRYVRGEKMANQRLRMLCLHGYGSNNEMTQMQMQHLQLSKKVQCDLLCAQIEVGPNDSTIAALSKGPFYSWFNWSAAIVGEVIGIGPGAAGGTLHDSLWRVLEHIKIHGPYDGIYGFSQGGVMATLLCSETVWSGLGKLDTCPFRFAVLGCAAGGELLRTMSISLSPRGGPAVGFQTSRAKLPVDIPSLHLIGACDVRRRSSHRLVAAYDPATAVTYEHAYGHGMPMMLLRDQKMQEVLTRFLQQF